MDLKSSTNKNIMDNCSLKKAVHTNSILTAFEKCYLGQEILIYCISFKYIGELNLNLKSTKEHAYEGERNSNKFSLN